MVIEGVLMMGDLDAVEEDSSSSLTTEGWRRQSRLSPLLTDDGIPRSKLFEALTPIGVFGSGLLSPEKPILSRDLTDDTVSDRSRTGWKRVAAGKV